MKDFIIVLFVLALGFASIANALEEPKPRAIPSPPSGYILDSNPNTPEDLLDRIKLDEIYRVKLDKWHDMGVQNDLNTQIRRMLLKSDASRAVLLRWYFERFAAKKKFDKDVDSYLSGSILTFLQQIETEQFSGQRVKEPENTDLALRAKQLEFARLYFEVLKPAGLSLDSPADDFKSIFAKYTLPELEQVSDPICKKAADYLRRTATSNEITMYLAAVCAFSGLADKHLAPLESFFRTKAEDASKRKDYAELADTIKGAMAFSKWSRADRNASLNGLLVKALTTNHETRQFAKFIIRYISKGIEIQPLCNETIKKLEAQQQTDEIADTLVFLKAASSNPAAFFAFPKPKIDGTNVLFGF